QTVALPIKKTYVEAWKMGLKAIAIYRDGCKRSQPLSTGKEEEKKVAVAVEARRRKLPDTRRSITHQLSVAGVHGYITGGMFEDGQPGEIFITLGKAGSTLAGFADAF